MGVVTDIIDSAGNILGSDTVSNIFNSPLTHLALGKKGYNLIDAASDEFVTLGATAQNDADELSLIHI